MRIGIDCRLWSESGVGRYIRNLVEQLLIVDRNNQYVLFVLTKDRKEILNSIRQAQDPEFTEGQVQNDNFRMVIADLRWHTIEEQLRFPEILNRENLDLVHFPYFSVPIFYNRPYVVTIHDLILHHFPTGEASTLPLPLYNLKLFGYKFVISHAAKKAKKIITVSNATKNEIIDHLGVSKDKVVVTYEGIDNKISNTPFDSAQGRQLKIQNYFLYVGNAYPHKNVDRLIQALNILISKYPNISLILVGKEDYFYKRLKEKVKKMNLEKSVLFYGQVSDEELVDLYKNAKALVMPSLMEGFGLPALEAMVSKCLVLSSNIPALREVCGDAAIYFDPFSVEDILKKMEAILLNDSNHFARNIKNGFERAKMFSWEKMAKETLEIYEKAVSSP